MTLIVNDLQVIPSTLGRSRDSWGGWSPFSTSKLKVDSVITGLKGDCPASCPALNKHFLFVFVFVPFLSFSRSFLLLFRLPQYLRYLLFLPHLSPLLLMSFNFIFFFIFFIIISLLLSPLYFSITIMNIQFSTYLSPSSLPLIISLYLILSFLPSLYPSFFYAPPPLSLHLSPTISLIPSHCLCFCGLAG